MSRCRRDEDDRVIRIEGVARERKSGLCGYVLCFASTCFASP